MILDTKSPNIRSQGLFFFSVLYPIIFRPVPNHYYRVGSSTTLPTDSFFSTKR